MAYIGDYIANCAVCNELMNLEGERDGGGQGYVLISQNKVRLSDALTHAGRRSNNEIIEEHICWSCLENYHFYRFGDRANVDFANWMRRGTEVVEYLTIQPNAKVIGSAGPTMTEQHLIDLKCSNIASRSPWIKSMLRKFKLNNSEYTISFKPGFPLDWTVEQCEQFLMDEQKKKVRTELLALMKSPHLDPEDFLEECTSILGSEGHSENRSQGQQRRTASVFDVSAMPLTSLNKIGTAGWSYIERCIDEGATIEEIEEAIEGMSMTAKIKKKWKALTD